MKVEPTLAKRASWVSILCSFVMSAETWVKLAELAGYTGTLHVPGTGIILRTSWAMVGVVDAYVVSALVLWTFTTNAKLGAFARKNTYAAATVGILAQAGYHGATKALGGDAVVLVVLSVVIGAIPPAFAAFGIHMRSLGLLAARTGVDSAKLTAGLLPLSLIHAAAVTADTVAALRAELTLTQETLSAVTAPRVTRTVTPAVSADTIPDDIRELTEALDLPAERLSAILDSGAPLPSRVPSVKSAALAWLADNAGDSSDSVLADKLVTLGLAGSLRTGYRYVKAYRATA